MLWPEEGLRSNSRRHLLTEGDIILAASSLIPGRSVSLGRAFLTGSEHPPPLWMQKPGRGGTSQKHRLKTRGRAEQGHESFMRIHTQKKLDSTDNETNQGKTHLPS